MTSTKIILPNVGKYGIDNLKLILAFVFKALGLGLTIDKNQDGNIDFPEIFSVVTAVSFQFPQLRSAFPFLKKEFKDLTPSELEELRIFVNETLDLPMRFDNLEEAMKITINLVAYNVRQIGRLRDLIKPNDGDEASDAVTKALV